MKPAQWRRQLEQVAAEHGATVELTKGGHLRVKHPSGWFVFQASTPGDHRALMNARSHDRRYAKQHESKRSASKSER